MATNNFSYGLDSKNGTSKPPITTTTTTSTSNGTPINNWTHPGPAAFDFRSDTITTPTASMLASITSTTLLDDVFLEDTTTNSLDAFIASLTGHAASLLVMSGTMGNQIALRTHLQGPPHAVLCDYRAHILEWEAGGTASLCGALVKGVVPSNGVYLTLEDVRKNAVISDDVHACPTRVISLENTLGGTIMPLSEARRICEWAAEHGILTHLDGARIWEAAAATPNPTETLKAFCETFDSVSLCYSKGLGAPIGSSLVGNETFIKRARWIRKSIGGGIRMSGIIAAAARTAVEETFLGGKLAESHERARYVAGLWEQRGGKLALGVETNMVWLDIAAAGVQTEEWVGMAREEGLNVLGGRLVVHYQVCDEAIGRLESVMDRALKRGTKRSAEETEG
ncbi:hypothetical protein K402DRAFT_394116 [Aulographum hederae CBS 113979]|uniref:Aromatic amino acid beta-eliminating lyase/threonine aldolase domain-containing protein n=1 Tax=Aulographum hederae CBS 113979 TaxID=1176131 RepID=A0A6G1GZV6_9PEZI|nr:hypothetical protein K402DRAFT_394116 [Aulographum hederae CBS 113979]